MRKFILKKDLLGMKAGKIIPECGLNGDDRGYLKFYPEWFEEVIEKPVVEDGYMLYYITNLGIEKNIFNPYTNPCDVYKTKEQAERELKFREAKSKIDNWIKKNEDGKLVISFEGNKDCSEIKDEILYLTNFYRNDNSI